MDLELDDVKKLFKGVKVTVESIERDTVVVKLENGSELEIEAVCDPDCSIFCSDESSDSCELDDDECDPYLVFHLLEPSKAGE